MINNHEIDYRIFGSEMQCVEIELDPEETIMAEPGSFMMMNDGVQMNTIFGDGSQQQGGILGKLMSAGKRMLTGESLFMTAYTNISQGKRQVTFAAPYPGKIIPLDLHRLGNRIICQKDAFLCAAKGVSIGIERIFAILEEKNASKARATCTQIMVAQIGKNLTQERFKILGELWSNGIAAETLYNDNPKVPK